MTRTATHAFCLAAALALAGVASAQAATQYEHTVFLHEYSGGLHIVPEQINAKVGDTLSLTVLNQGASPHNLRVCGDTPPKPSIDCGESWGQTPYNIAPNASAPLTVEVTKAGTFEYYCFVPGHKGAGMVGTLMVEGEEKNGMPALGVPIVLALVLALALARRSRS